MAISDEATSTILCASRESTETKTETMSRFQESAPKRTNVKTTSVFAGQASNLVAEMEGFEPSRGLNLNPLSRRAH